MRRRPSAAVRRQQQGLSVGERPAQAHHHHSNSGGGGTINRMRLAAAGAANSLRESTKVVRSHFPAAPRVNVRKPSFAISNRDLLRQRMLEEAVTEEEPVLIYDSMRELWADDVMNLPVCKDLPRLIRRVCVMNEEEDILFLPPGSNLPEKTKLHPPKPKAHNSLENFYTALSPENVTTDLGSDSEKEGSDCSDSEAGKPRRSSRLDRWSLLKKRKSQAKEEDLSSNSTVVKLITDFINVLAPYFEDEEECERIASALGPIRDTVSDGTDLQHVVSDIINVLGSDSRIVGVLKCIHQNVVLHSTVELKTKLTMKYNTKDIRTADGWRIVVSLNKGYVQVRHIRREQSMDAFGDTKNHWELEWELRMTFDSKMSEMTAAQLRISRLVLSETMDDELAEELKSTLVDNLIVM